MLKIGELIARKKVNGCESLHLADLCFGEVHYSLTSREICKSYSTLEITLACMRGSCGEVSTKFLSLRVKRKKLKVMI
jgi:hypothetical protein